MCKIIFNVLMYLYELFSGWIKFLFLTFYGGMCQLQNLNTAWNANYSGPTCFPCQVGKVRVVVCTAVQEGHYGWPLLLFLFRSAVPHLVAQYITGPQRSVRVAISRQTFELPRK